MPSSGGLRQGFTNPSSSSRQACAVAKAKEPVEQGREASTAARRSRAASPARGSSGRRAGRAARGIQGTCSALHSTLVPHVSASPSPCVLQGLWPGDCKRKQNPGTWQSMSDLRVPAQNGKKHVLQGSFSFNIFNIFTISSQMRHSQFYYLFFLVLVLLQPQLSLFWLALSP